MNFLDVLIVIIIILQAYKWGSMGFFSSFFALAGTLSGLLISFAIAPLILVFFDDEILRLLAGLLIVMILVVALGTVGKVIGLKLKELVTKIKLKPVDSALGATFSIFATTIFLWLALSAFSSSPFPNLNQQIRNSRIIQAVNNQLPPAPAIISSFNRYINRSIFPQVFTGIEPRPVEPVTPPTDSELNNAAQASQNSVARIESLACGGLLSGSGFFVTNNRVVTNAHVVAGSNQPSITTISGSYRAEVIHFDPDNDIAVLYVPDADIQPLNLVNNVLPRGTTGATLGFPRGEDLTIGPAAILRDLEARGRDIYSRNTVIRNVYELQTNVVSGNSGGPVVLPNGDVFAVIFAKSETTGNTGYAIPSPKIIETLATSANRTAPVNTGNCVR
jgi:S1-C subfamily serine protease